jgi:hypothetical protein
MEKHHSIIRPLASFQIQQGAFVEAHVDQIRTSEEQEEFIRQYVAKIVAVAGTNVEATILMHMIDTKIHAALIINNGTKDIISFNTQAQYADDAIYKLYNEFTSSIPPSIQPQGKPARKMPDERNL